MADISDSQGSLLQTEVGNLERVLLRHARDAFGSSELVKAQWKGLNYLSQPRFDEACREYDQFAELLERLGVSLEWMEGDLGLDSVPVRVLRSYRTGVSFCARWKRALGLLSHMRRAVSLRDLSRCMARSNKQAPLRW